MANGAAYGAAAVPHYGYRREKRDILLLWAAVFSFLSAVTGGTKDKHQWLGAPLQ